MAQDPSGHGAAVRPQCLRGLQNHGVPPGGHVPLPAHPGDAPATVQEEPVPRVDTVARAGGAAGAVVAERSRSAVGAIHEEPPRRPAGVHRLQEREAGLKTDVTRGIPRSQVEVRDQGIAGVVGRHGELERSV